MYEGQNVSSPDPGTTPRAWIVIPCYNEAQRLDAEAIGHLVQRRGLNVLLIDDGSVDGTRTELQIIRRRLGERVDVLELMSNGGKGEAVRHGLNYAVGKGADIVGYLDADFATPSSEIHRLLDVLDQHKHVKALLGSRWLHLGSRIERSFMRHLSGRIFATLASTILGMNVYDTQCGAKLFRVTDNLKAALADPFISSWAFDVELIGRLDRGVGCHGYTTEEFLEVPLNVWVDIEGSKVSPVDAIKMALQMFAIARSLRYLSRHSYGAIETQ